MKKLFAVLSMLVVAGMVLAACTPAAEAPAAEAPAAEEPTQVDFACITTNTVEQPWHTAFAQAFDRVAADAPYDLEMTLTCTENVAPPDAERILRQYAETGEYEVIWAHSSYYEAVKVLAPEFPDIAWMFTGSGNEGVGGNAYWGDVFIHEPAYLAGIIAGYMTETNKLGAVAAFPFPNVNAPVNAFYDGALSVNPDVTFSVTYIESWFDPVKGKESASAQIAAGADIIYAERFGPFEAAQEGNALAFGHFLDQSSLSPDVVITSPMAKWDPNIRNIIEKWYDYTVNGVAYDAPMERIVFNYIEGGSTLSPYHDFDSIIPQEAKDAVDAANEAILAGDLVIPIKADAFEEGKEPTAAFKAAFVYVAPIGDLGWTWAHDQARQQLEADLGIETAYIEMVPEGPEGERVIRDFAMKGYDLIFTTSFGYMDPTITVAEEFPDIQFVHISGFKSAPNASNVFGRMYQPRYLSGLVAGAATESNIIGYVAAFPIPEVIRGINAFTLGVREVNPAAEVRVVWTNTWFGPPEEKEAADALLAAGADIIAQHQDTTEPQKAAADAGALSIGYDSDMAQFVGDRVLTSPIWNWGVKYVEIAEQVMAGTYDGSESYWGGMAEGVVALAPLSDRVSADTAALVEEKSAAIVSGDWDVFCGPVVGANGNLVVAEGDCLDDGSMLGMDYWVDGVSGEVPGEAPGGAEAAAVGLSESGGLLDLNAGSCDYGGKIQQITALDSLTVKFNLCKPDPAFLAKAAFTPFGVQPREWIEETGGGGDILDNPVGTGPWALKEWARGDSITYSRFEDYWGDQPVYDTLVFRWATEGAARLLELQSGTVDQITNLSPDDFTTVQNDSSLTFIPVANPNILYLAMTNTFTPFDDVKVRQAIGMGIDRQRIVDNFYPEGSEVASHFTPCSIPNGCTGDAWYDFDPEAAQALLAEAGYPDGFESSIFYRDVFRGYLPEPGLVAVEFQTQLRDNLGIEVDVVVMESGEFIDESTQGNLDGFYLLGWGADYPHVTNFLDFHFSAANPQYGETHPEIYEVLEQASQIGDPAEAEALYTEANNAIRELAPMVPIAHGASASAALASVDNAHFRPFGAPLFHYADPGKDTFVFMQNAEPISLYCADETDGESLAPCQQVVEPLYDYEIDSGNVRPILATSCEPNGDLTAWTCALREGVKFHDGSDLDANDVVMSWAAAIDAGSPYHVGNTGAFEYYAYLWDGLMDTSQ